MLDLLLPIKIKVILGTTRQRRFGDKPAHWITDEAKALPDVEVELLDLRDYAIPFFDEPMSPMWGNRSYTNEAIQRWADRISEADAFIMIAPEYNHGYPAVLKNAIDYDLPGVDPQAGWVRQLRQHGRGPRGRATQAGRHRNADVADQKRDSHSARGVPRGHERVRSGKSRSVPAVEGRASQPRGAVLQGAPLGRPRPEARAQCRLTCDSNLRRWPAPRRRCFVVRAAWTTGPTGRDPALDWPAFSPEVRQALASELQPVSLKNCTLRRYGSANDGGYLMCENLIDTAAAAYWYGIDTEDNWGCDISKQRGIVVHQYDCFTPHRPTCDGGQFAFHNECVGPRRESVDGHPFDTLPSQIARNGHAGKPISS